MASQKEQGENSPASTPTYTSGLTDYDPWRVSVTNDMDTESEPAVSPPPLPDDTSDAQFIHSLCDARHFCMLQFVCNNIQRYNWFISKCSAAAEALDRAVAEFHACNEVWMKTSRAIPSEANINMYSMYYGKVGYFLFGSVVSAGESQRQIEHQIYIEVGVIRAERSMEGDKPQHKTSLQGNKATHSTSKCI